MLLTPHAAGETQRHEDNVRSRDQQVAQIAASIREFGFTNPVLIDEEDGIIAGNGRVLAAHYCGDAANNVQPLPGIPRALAHPKSPVRNAVTPMPIPPTVPPVGAVPTPAAALAHQFDRRCGAEFGRARLGWGERGGMCRDGRKGQ